MGPKSTKKPLQKQTPTSTQCNATVSETKGHGNNCPSSAVRTSSRRTSLTPKAMAAKESDESIQPVTQPTHSTKKKNRKPYVPPIQELRPCVECQNDCGGAHKCPDCNGWIHGCCGDGIGEETYGQPRLCSTCKNKSSSSNQPQGNNKSTRKRKSSLDDASAKAGGSNKGGANSAYTIKETEEFLKKYKEVEESIKSRRKDKSGDRDARFANTINHVNELVATELNAMDLFKDRTKPFTRAIVASFLHNIKSRFGKEVNDSGLERCGETGCRSEKILKLCQERWRKDKAVVLRKEDYIHVGGPKRGNNVKAPKQAKKAKKAKSSVMEHGDRRTGMEPMFSPGQPPPDDEHHVLLSDFSGSDASEDDSGSGSEGEVEDEDEGSVDSGWEQQEVSDEDEVRGRARISKSDSKHGMRQERHLKSRDREMKKEEGSIAKALVKVCETIGTSAHGDDLKPRIEQVEKVTTELNEKFDKKFESIEKTMGAIHDMLIGMQPPST